MPAPFLFYTLLIPKLAMHFYPPIKTYNKCNELHIFIARFDDEHEWRMASNKRQRKWVSNKYIVYLHEYFILFPFIHCISIPEISVKSSNYYCTWIYKTHCTYEYVMYILWAKVIYASHSVAKFRLQTDWLWEETDYQRSQ